jgi:chromate reductase
METIKIAGFGGSLRKQSYSRYLLENAVGLMPENSKLEILDIKNFPLMNQDEENNYPENVKKFKKQIRESDGVLIATPEYDYSIPGYLKNVIDVASRPYGDNPFNGKPVAFMSSSIGMMGGSRAQYHLRQVCVFLDMIPVNKPEVFLTFAQDKFNENGKLTDDMTAKFVGQLLENLVNLSRQLKK